MTAHDYWLHRKENLEAGQLTESLLPTEVLRSVLETAAPTLTTIVEPVQWYYENLNVQPLHLERSLVFRVNLPIVETTPYRYLQFAVWPIPLQSGYLHLTLPYSVLHETVQCLTPYVSVLRLLCVHLMPYMMQISISALTGY